jgi:hypothetical protein
MALNSTLTIDWSAVLAVAQDLTPGGVHPIPVAKRVAMALSSGILANQADVIFADTRNLAASATDTLDLIGGGLLDVGKVAFAPAKLKGLLVVAAPTNVNNVNVVRPATLGVTIFLAAGDGIAVGPGGYFAWAAPTLTTVAVAAGVSDQLQVINSAGGTAVDYDIIIVGTSA